MRISRSIGTSTRSETAPNEVLLRVGCSTRKVRQHSGPLTAAQRVGGYGASGDFEQQVGQVTWRGDHRVVGGRQLAVPPAWLRSNARRGLDLRGVSVLSLGA